MPVLSKKKGSTYENKIAKELGLWMFSDKNMLCRHLTSGAQKSVYIGDIVPQKRLPDGFNSGIWTFVIECKNGYKNQIPNLNNQTIVRTWLKKLYQEMIDHPCNQKIIYLIASFHGYSPLLFTDLKLNPELVYPDLIINIKIISGEIIPFYIYKYKELLELPFFKIYDNTEIINKLK